MEPPTELAKLAWKRNELEEFILARSPYVTRSRMSPASGETDLVELFSQLYRFVRARPVLRWRIRRKLQGILEKLAERYEAFHYLPTLMIMENDLQRGNLTKKDPPLGLDLIRIADILRRSIPQFEKRLLEDFSGEAFRTPWGMWGKLMGASKLLIEGGGPGFMTPPKPPGAK